MTSRYAGFTLIELMMTLALLAILLGLAAPSLRDLIMSSRITAQANDLMTDLAMARSEAVKRNSRTAICPSSDGTNCTKTAWQQGWIIFVDPDSDGKFTAATDTIIKVQSALDGNSTLVTAGLTTNGDGALFIPYRPSGTVNPGGGNAIITFTLCDSRTTANKGRLITISVTGRAYVKSHTCL